jgi:hypothetical protein
VNDLKPAATALLLGPEESVVMAVERAGAGYSVYLGADEFCNAAYRGGAHERFWAGVVRFLTLGKKLAGSRDMSLDSDRDRYNIGEEVVLEAGVFDANREPLKLPQVTVAVEASALDPGAEGQSVAGGAPGNGKNGDPGVRLRVALQAVAGRPGWYSGRFTAEHPGRYVARLDGVAGAAGGGGAAASRTAESPAGGGAAAEAGKEASFLVVAATAEWDDPSPNFECLDDLAARTGGSFVGLEDIGEVAGRIPDRSVRETIGRAASTVWDSAAVMVLFSALMIMEWALRKWWRLN